MAKSSKKPQGKKKKNKTREVFECLLVAAALALTIRHFGFQIFKIPTRSMEPALYGHPDYGDRVVAMMWYKRGGFLPLKLGKLRRWQVIVFNHEDNDGRPTNFIKRLVGLPGERVELRDGDVWIARPDEREAHIERKPRRLQESLWIKLCDLDLSRPWRLPKYWKAVPAGAAKVEDGRLVVEAPEGKKARIFWKPDRAIDNRYIRPTVMYLTCRDRECRTRFRAVFDTAHPVAFCPKCHRAVYGVHDGGHAGVLENNVHFWSEQEMNIDDAGIASMVPDIRLCLDFQVLAGDGELRVVLTGRGEEYQFRLPLGGAGPVAELSGPRGLRATRKVPLEPGATHHIEVVNVDGEFRAELDGVEIGPARYAPPPDPGTSDARIVVTGGARVALDNLRLYRDIYYGHTTRGQMHKGGPGEKTSYIDVPRRHYFFMGDNSLASKDGRIFGTKAEEKIVARGIFVAWPPSRIHGVR